MYSIKKATYYHDCDVDGQRYDPHLTFGVVLYRLQKSITQISAFSKNIEPPTHRPYIMCNTRNTRRCTRASSKVISCKSISYGNPYLCNCSAYHPFSANNEILRISQAYHLCHYKFSGYSYSSKENTSKLHMQ